MNCILALRPSEFLSGKYWQIVSYGFLHATEGSLAFFHIMMNMYGLYALGNYIEPVIGKTRFTYLYIVSLLGGGIMIISFYLITIYTGSSFLTIAPNSPTIGASGAIFGLLVLFGILYPEVYLLLIFFPIRAKNFTLVVLIVGLVLEHTRILPISNAGHLGGAVFGYLYYYIFLKNRLRNVIVKPIDQNIEEKTEKHHAGFEETFLEQTRINLKLLERIESFDTTDEKIEFLHKLQVENANICPPGTFNEEDEFCLRCEWFANCALRREKGED